MTNGKWKKGTLFVRVMSSSKNSCWFKHHRPADSGHSFASALSFFKLVFWSPHFSMMPCSISARNNPSLEQTPLEGSTGAAEEAASTWSLPARHSAEPWVSGPWEQSEQGHHISAAPKLGTASDGSAGLCLSAGPRSRRQQGDAGGCRGPERHRGLHWSLWGGTNTLSSLPVPLIVDWQIYGPVSKLFFLPHFFPGCDFGS